MFNVNQKVSEQQKINPLHIGEEWVNLQPTN